MATPKLLTAGEAFEDLVFVGLERLPAPGEEIKTDRFHATVGGGAVITAVAAARLGMPSAVTSALSDAAVTRLRHERVRVHNLKHRAEPHAITAALSTTTDRAFVTFNGVNAVLEPRLLDALATVSATHLHLALCPTDIDAWTRLIARMRRRGVTVSWDFGWSEALAIRPELPELMDALDFVFLNELEAPLYAAATSVDGAYPVLRARKAAVIVKLGSIGSRWLRAEGDVVMPAPRVDPVDTTGAGDAFNAGFLCAWLRGRPPATCLATGNAVGAASTQTAGGLDALPHARMLPPLLRPTAPRRPREAKAKPAKATRPAKRKNAEKPKAPAPAPAPRVSPPTAEVPEMRLNLAKGVTPAKRGSTAARPRPRKRTLAKGATSPARAKPTRRAKPARRAKRPKGAASATRAKLAKRAGPERRTAAAKRSPAKRPAQAERDVPARRAAAKHAAPARKRRATPPRRRTS